MGESWREAGHGQRLEKSEEEQLGAHLLQGPSKRPSGCGLPRTPPKGSDQAREGREGTEGLPGRVQGLTLHTLTAWGTSSVPRRGTKTLHASRCNRKTRIQYEKVNINTF